jgi:hypothetical protein
MVINKYSIWNISVALRQLFYTPKPLKTNGKYNIPSVMSILRFECNLKFWIILSRKRFRFSLISLLDSICSRISNEKLASGKEKLGSPGSKPPDRRDPDPLAESWKELTSAHATATADVTAFVAEAHDRAGAWAKNTNGEGRARQCRVHAARERLHPLAERCRPSRSISGRNWWGG